MIKKKSVHDVTTTLDNLEAILKDKGIGIVARVNHAAAAEKVEMALRPTQVLFFGNPRLGTPLMQSNQLAGLELPMRVLAWEDEDGHTWLGYHSPQHIGDELGIADRTEAIEKLSGAMDNLTDVATT